MITGLEDLTKEKIESMPYADFVALTREVNRPSGGIKTIRKIIQNTFLDKDSEVLEVGCNTGFTSLEIGRLAKCKVLGIDICSSAVEIATELANKDSRTSDSVRFAVMDAMNTKLPNKSYDLVVCGNATSFMKDKDAAFKEYIRLTKDWGFISITPVYYIKTPPPKIIRDVSTAIDAKVDTWDKNFWIKPFIEKNLELYYMEDFTYDYKSEKDLNIFVKFITNKPHLRNLDTMLKKTIQKRSFKLMSLFNENLKYCNYSVLLFRKRTDAEEMELFTSYRLKNPKSRYL